MNNVLQVSHLTKTFTSGFWLFQKKSYTAVHDISFTLQEGEILGFLGANGAGKTTTIQMLLQTLLPTSGSIIYFGKDVKTHPIQSLKHIGYASGYDKLPRLLTIYENLDIVGRIYNIPSIQRKERIHELLHTFQLLDLKNRQVASLSAGQATRVMLVKAFMNRPSIVFLDEPTASLDPDIAHHVRTFILEQQKQYGTSILITSHNMEEVTELCDRVLVMKQGSIIANATPQELAQKISKTKLHITIEQQQDRAFNLIAQEKLSYSVLQNQYIIELDEHALPSFLIKLSSLEIVYTHISIEKPTLEDYFLAISSSQ